MGSGKSLLSPMLGLSRVEFSIDKRPSAVIFYPGVVMLLTIPQSFIGASSTACSQQNLRAWQQGRPHRDVLFAAWFCSVSPSLWRFYGGTSCWRGRCRAALCSRRAQRPAWPGLLSPASLLVKEPQPDRLRGRLTKVAGVQCGKMAQAQRS
jgi:hypothetical protein